MDRLATIRRGGAWIDNKNFHEIKSLNTWKRQQEMIALSYNNQTMLSRLLNCHSQYNHHKLEDEYLLTRKHRENVRKYPKDWKKIMYQMKCIKKHMKKKVIDTRTGKTKKLEIDTKDLKNIEKEASEMEKAAEEVKRQKEEKEKELKEKSERLKAITEKKRVMEEWKKSSEEWRKAREERLKLAEENKMEEVRKLAEVKKREKKKHKKKREKIKKELEEWKKWKDVNKTFKTEEDKMKLNEKEKMEREKKRREKTKRKLEERRRLKEEKERIKKENKLKEEKKVAATQRKAKEKEIAIEIDSSYEDSFVSDSSTNFSDKSDESKKKDLLPEVPSKTVIFVDGGYDTDLVETDIVKDFRADPNELRDKIEKDLLPVVPAKTVIFIDGGLDTDLVETDIVKDFRADPNELRAEIKKKERDLKTNDDPTTQISNDKSEKTAADNLDSFDDVRSKSAKQFSDKKKYKITDKSMTIADKGESESSAEEQFSDLSGVENSDERKQTSDSRPLDSSSEYKDYYLQTKVDDDVLDILLESPERASTDISDGSENGESSEDFLISSDGGSVTDFAEASES